MNEQLKTDERYLEAFRALWIRITPGPGVGEGSTILKARHHKDGFQYRCGSGPWCESLEEAIMEASK